MSIECKTEIPAIPGLNDNELTVGREFLLVCDGEFPRDLVLEKTQFVFEKQNKYILHLLNMEFRSPTTADLKVTSYQAGTFEIPSLQISDGVQTLDIGGLKLQVQSVLPPPDPQTPGMQQEAYGPIGPAHLPVPPLYWGLLIGAILILISLIGVRVYRMLQRKRMLEELREHDAALSPLAQFHQNYRRLQRKNPVFFGVKEASKEAILECLHETQDMLKLYLTRRFQVPAMDWSERLVLRDIRKYHGRRYKENGDELAKLFKEYSRAHKDEEHLKVADVLVIATHCRSLVEKMERPL